jgi:hypothetical protein
MNSSNESFKKNLEMMMNGKDHSTFNTPGGIPIKFAPVNLIEKTNEDMFQKSKTQNEIIVDDGK